MTRRGFLSIARCLPMAAPVSGAQPEVSVPAERLREYFECLGRDGERVNRMIARGFRFTLTSSLPSQTKETASLGSLSPNPTAYGLLMRNLLGFRSLIERAAS